MHMDRKATDVKTTIWLPRTLHRAAKAYAATHGTSVRAVIITALAAFFAERKETDR
jgi:hypothetical protein